MADIVTKDNFKDIIGYDIISDDLKNKLSVDPNIKKQVENWLAKHIGKGQLSAVKKCKVKHMVYEECDEEEMDEFEHKKYIADVRKNFRECPSHQTCPLFCNDTISEGEDCVLELIDTQHLTQGLVEELDIDKDEFNDQIIIGQLVSMNIIYNRAMRGLSAAPLIEEVKTFTKGGVNIDTKVNENFTVAERALTMMEKLRKSLVLNRDDKLKVKQIKKANDEAAAKKRVEEKMRQIESEVSIDDDYINQLEEEFLENIEV